MIPTSIYNLSVDFTGNQLFAAAVEAGKKFSTGEIIGVWIATALTIFIFSFLYEDNAMYKFAEHLFVGVSAGYVMATTYNNVIKPNLFGKIQSGIVSLMHGQFVWKDLSFILAGLMGLMLLMKLVPNMGWLSRWPLSFMVGIASGLGIVFTMEALVLKQIDATLVPLIVKTAANSIDIGDTIKNWLIVIGVCSGLIYFYFSKEHKGLVFGTMSRIGIFVLMMAFGAAFGYTVMARVSLLIGRMLFFRDQWWPVVKATFHF
ncbi:MAG: hypothetical protein LWY06_13895 [Firmicutes bacterium]|nr:hypothetical protein [Bacillota bacterium]